MNHKLNDVGQLYADSQSLYKDVVSGEADTIINDLGAAINSLKETWEGKDAGVQINNVIDVYNAMTRIREALAELSKDSSAVASEYRRIQNANRANLPDLAPISISMGKPAMDSYVDNRDTVNIVPDARNGQRILENIVRNTYDAFEGSVNRTYQKIMDNWQAGTGRGKAEDAFNDFMANSRKYKQTLEDASNSIVEALKNYSN